MCRAWARAQPQWCSSEKERVNDASRIPRARTLRSTYLRHDGPPLIYVYVYSYVCVYVCMCVLCLDAVSGTVSLSSKDYYDLGSELFCYQN